jgi:hypothetical protein
MPSYDPSLFNVDPYYDDFSEDKKFLRLMFRPGYAVQARELTQIQTILQNQIERFGSHVFEEGSIVLDGQISESRVKYAKVNLPTTATHTDFVGTVISKAGRAKARVIHAEGGLSGSTLDEESVLFFEYIEGGTGFQANDIIAATAANGTGITASVTGPNNYFLGDALVASVDRGVRFIEGYFVLNDAQSIGAYTLTGSAGSKIRNYNNPTTRIGFQATKSFVTATDDTTLTDPAFGFYNYAAPGSDRFKIDMVLSQVGYTASDTSAVDNFSREGFVEFMRVVDGDIVKVEKYPDYAVLEDTLARRTYDESGNYTVTPFELTLKGPTTVDSTAVLKAELSSGKAYVFGYEFETQANTRLNVPCARGVSHERTVTRDFNRVVGPFTKVTFSGIPDSFGKTADFAAHPKVILSAGASGAAINQIGTARIRSVAPYQSTVFDIGLYDIAITGASTFSDVTRIFMDEKSGTTKHLFNITGSAGLEREDQGCLLYQIPEGSGVTAFSSGDYAIVAYATASASSDPYHFSINSYVVAGDVMDFSVSTTPVALPNADVMVFTEDGVAVGGTAARNPSSSTNLQLTVNGANGKKLIVLATQEVQNDSVAMGSGYTKTKTLNTFSGTLTGAFGTSLTGDGKGSTSDVLYLNGYSDVVQILSLTGSKGASSGIDLLPYFTFDNGQRDSHYDWGRMYLVPGVTGISGPYSATFTYYSNSGRGPFTVRSYPNYETIPNYTSMSTGIVYSLRDCIDFRPIRGMSGNMSATPWIPSNSAANDNDFTYTHFLPRTDKIALTRDRKFTVISGIPSLNADIPADDPNAMTLYTVRVNPYTFSSDDASVRYIENKRYTMRDIGNLEKRIEAVEYYTTLNLLEQEAKAKSIRDENGDEMPKRGILVDQFKGHAVADNTDAMFAASIDYENNELRPPFAVRSYGLTAGALSGITGNTADGIYTLNYTTSEEISNLLASSYTTINPFSVITFLGSMKISPASDIWYDTTKQAKVRVNVEGENDNWKDNSKYGFGTRFNDWESTWFGADIGNVKNTRPNLVRNKLLTTKTEGLSVSSISSSIAPESMKKVVNNKVVARDVLPVARERTINVSVSGLRPNTAFRVYCDEVDVTTTCTGGAAVTNNKGEASFQYLFNHPASGTNFLVGRHTIRVTDGTDINNPSSWAMSAEATYSIEGAYNSIAEDGQLSTRVLETRRKSVKSDRVISNLSEIMTSQGEVRGYNEPIAQTFYVDPVKYPAGIYAKFVDLFFHTKETLTTIPVTVQIRPTLSGYPHPSKVLPFASSTLYSDSITNVVDYITDGDSDHTRFNFTSPIYLLPGKEYAISISSNSGNYSLLTGSLGSTILTESEDDPKINITKQPFMRALFRSQNTGKLSKNDNETLAFRLGVCKFNASGTMDVLNEAMGATASLYVNQIRFNTTDATPEGTSISYSSEVATSPATELGNITPNKNIDPPSGVYTIPSSNTEGGVSTITVSMTRPNVNEFVSPIFDMEKSSILTVTNLINNQTDSARNGAQYNGELDYVNTASQFKTAARYISKKVTLEDGMEAENITVSMSLCNPKKNSSTASSIQVFVRPVPVGETDPEDVEYVKLSTTDSAISTSDDDFREVSFTNIGYTTLPKFKTFSIKVVMFGADDGAAIPRIRNLRMIAT